MGNHFRLESVDSGIATIRSRAVLDTDFAASWFIGRRFVSNMPGTEDGVCHVDVATGMPTGIEDTVRLISVVQSGRSEGYMHLEKIMKMAGRMVKN